MEPISYQQEILLIRDSSFALRQCCALDDKGDANLLSVSEQLQNACWNGLLPEMLPEIMEPRFKHEPLYLWQIKEADAFLEIELCEEPEKKDRYFSLNPYQFLEYLHHN